jgi:adenosylcobinamide-phosphate synthase
MAYKAINTLDSMVGYKNERYRSFGWAAARLDDAANYIPARLSGMIIVASVFLFTLVRDAGSALSAARRAFFVMVRDGRNHPSPNSGVPEAAMAGALDVRLGGPSQYAGVVCDKPFIGDSDDRDYLAASRTAHRLVIISSLAAAGIAAGVVALRGGL